ncbi:GIP [Symbiodinium sp. CCMP2592]|nr:GIP [Symbiodinium sp. CCMP2592]
MVKDNGSMCRQDSQLRPLMRHRRLGLTAPPLLPQAAWLLDGDDGDSAGPVVGLLLAMVLRRGDEPPRLPDPPLPLPEAEHPRHLLTLDDVKAATPAGRDKASTATWNSRMGPEKNVRWRGGTPPPPPAWKYDVTDLRAFSKWARKVEIWRVQIKSYMTARDASLLLYTSLSGEAEAELEHAPLDRINHENGIDYILETLKAPMEQKGVYQKRKFLSDFEQLNRYPGEGLRTFANRYRRVERSLEALGVNITGMYDTEARGNRLLERARLTMQDQRLILVGARHSLAFDDISESMVLQYPEFKAAPPVVNKDGSLATKPHAGPRDKGGKGAPQQGQPSAGKGYFQNRGDRGQAPPKKVFVTEEAPEQDGDPADEEDDQQDHDGEPAEDQVPEPDGDPEEPDHGACGEKGHWKGDAECPMTVKPGAPPSRPGPSAPSSSTSKPGPPARHDKTKKPPHQTFYMRDAGTYEATDSPDYGFFPDDDMLWEKEHGQELRKHGLCSYQVPCTDAFQFGSGGPLKAARRSYLPIGLGGTNLIVGAGAVDAKVPLLASNRLLDQLGMVLDLPRDLVCFETSVTVPLYRISGHLAVRITDFSQSPSWRQLQEAVNWESPPAELAARDTSNPTSGPDLSFHDRGDLAPPSASCMAALLATPGHPPDDVPPGGLQEPGNGREPRHPSGQPLHHDSPGARRAVRFPREQVRPSGLCPLRQRLREVRQVQAVPPEAPLERQPSRVGGPSRQKVRHFAANFATALALLIQYCTGGTSIEQQAVPAFSPDFFEGGVDQGFTQEALGTASVGKQRFRDGTGPLEAPASGGGVGSVRLERGRMKRLKGSWFRSARHIYDQAPTTSSRPPPTVDVLTVTPDTRALRPALAMQSMTSASLSPSTLDAMGRQPEGERDALRVLRRLRPHVTYLSYLDFFPGDLFNLSVQKILPEPIVIPWHDGSEQTVRLYTNIPGARARFTDNTASDQDLPDRITYMIRDYVTAKEPLRFGIFEAFVNYQTPVTELTAWNEMADMLQKSFGSSSTRPFYVDPAGEVGKKIGELFRLQLNRIQCVQTPTQRRMPPDLPYTARGAFLIFSDGSRAVEVEDLNLIQHPKQRFSKPVKYAIFAYGDLLEETAQPAERTLPEAPVPGMPTDISFPGLSATVPLEVRRAIARAHVNLGHASPEELLRLAVQTGTPSDLFLQAIRRMRCATCERLRGPQQPPPATSAAKVTQFGDRVEADIFYIRDLRGRSVPVLGVVDCATRLQQAAVLPSRDPEDLYEALERVWLRPFGLMVEIAVDPDGSFQGAFEERLRSHGVLVNFCPADAHWRIGQVERQNSFLRLPGGLFTDEHFLASTPTTDAAASAEIVRSEALKVICDLNVKQGLRRVEKARHKEARRLDHCQVPELGPQLTWEAGMGLKDAAKTLDQSLWADETGPEPSKRELEQDEPDMEQVTFDNMGPDMAAATMAAIPAAVEPQRQLPSSDLNIQQRTQTVVIQPHVQQTIIQNTARLGDPAQGSRRATSMPRTPRVGLESAQYESAPFNEIPGFEEEPPVPPPPHAQGAEEAQHEVPEPPVPQAPQPQSVSSSSRPPTTPVTSQPSSGTEPGGNLLPAKRPFETLATLFYEDGCLHHCVPGEILEQGYGPKFETFYEAYLSSTQRKDDLAGSSKDPTETDTSDSDWDDEAPTKGNKPMRRAEAKALDREIPWRKILEMSEADIEAFKAATIKEAKSWEEWGSVKPLTHQEAQKVLRDKVLCKRILRTRSCFRDKSRGLSQLMPKCRVVALGHKDPDIFRLNRECATPNRTSEHVLFCIMTAGSNKEFDDTGLLWKGWSGDASTAFLQGDIAASEREQPLYLLPPNDGITSLTPCWKAPLYLVCTNIYGLSNAPRLWSLTVISRLKDLDYRQHSFDKMVFLKFKDDRLISIIDYDITEVTNAFRWGVLHSFEVGKTVTFKGKQLTLEKKETGRIVMRVCQREFIEGLDPGRVPRGSDLTQVLDPQQRGEFRSLAGCLQWLSGQSRPELSAVNSLANHGAQTTLGDLRDLYEAVDFARKTKEYGFVVQDVPLNRATVILAYSDASWANAQESRSQCGALVVLCHASVLQKQVPAMVVDWKSSRSQRVCRSTLASESCAADEACDRSAYLNMYLGEILYNVPAHRVGYRLHNLGATDAKSLYDVVVSDTPNLSDKRSLVNIRAIQEVVSSDRYHWVPTTLMWADGLTKHSPELLVSLFEWLQEPTATLKE